MRHAEQEARRFCRAGDVPVAALEALTMLSKKQTDVAAEVLMHGVRQQRKVRSLLLAGFPELSGLPASRRNAVLKAAYSAVWRKGPMILGLAVAVALIGLWTWAVIVETVSAGKAWLAPFLVIIGLHRLNRYLLRRELRRLVEAEQSQGGVEAAEPAFGRE